MGEGSGEGSEEGCGEGDIDIIIRKKFTIIKVCEKSGIKKCK